MEWSTAQWKMREFHSLETCVPLCVTLHGYQMVGDNLNADQSDERWSKVNNIACNYNN